MRSLRRPSRHLDTLPKWQRLPDSSMFRRAAVYVDKILKGTKRPANRATDEV